MRSISKCRQSVSKGRFNKKSQTLEGLGYLAGETGLEPAADGFGGRYKAFCNHLYVFITIDITAFYKHCLLYLLIEIDYYLYQ
jgi:hypothetical protein